MPEERLGIQTSRNLSSREQGRAEEGGGVGGCDEEKLVCRTIILDLKYMFYSITSIVLRWYMRACRSTISHFLRI